MELRKDEGWVRLRDIVAGMDHDHGWGDGEIGIRNWNIWNT